MTSSVPHVAVVGPGAIGVTFAAAVQDAAGRPPVLCARRAIAPPALVRDDGAEVALRCTVLTDPAAIHRRAGAVLCAVKAHQVPGAAAWLRRLCGPDTLVVALMNGVEHEALLRPWVGDATVVPAIVWAPVSPERDGRSPLRGPARVQVPPGAAGERFAALLDGGFGVVRQPEDFLVQSWQKLLVNAVSGLMAAADRPPRRPAAGVGRPQRRDRPPRPRPRRPDPGQRRPVRAAAPRLGVTRTSAVARGRSMQTTTSSQTGRWSLAWAVFGRSLRPRPVGVGRGCAGRPRPVSRRARR